MINLLNTLKTLTKPTNNKKIRKVNPKATPRICGNVFFIPKLKPE